MASFYEHFHKMNNLDRRQRKADTGDGGIPGAVAQLRQAYADGNWASVNDVADNLFFWYQTWQNAEEYMRGQVLTASGEPAVPTFAGYPRDGGKARKASTKSDSVDDALAKLRAVNLKNWK